MVFVLALGNILQSNILAMPLISRTFLFRYLTEFLNSTNKFINWTLNKAVFTLWNIWYTYKWKQNLLNWQYWRTVPETIKHEVGKLFICHDYKRSSVRINPSGCISKRA